MPKKKDSTPAEKIETYVNVFDKPIGVDGKMRQPGEEFEINSNEYWVKPMIVNGYIAKTGVKQ